MTQTIDKNMRFTYFRVPSPIGTRFITAVIQKDTSSEDNGDLIPTTKYNIAFSFYSPNIEKTPFSKAKGRQIAIARIDRGKKVITVNNTCDDTFGDSMPDLALQALHQVIDSYESDFEPSWLVRALLSNRVIPGLKEKKPKISHCDGACENCSCSSMDESND